MTRPDPEHSELTTAAQALEEELQRFEALAEALKKAPLDSQKNLERAAKSLHDVATLDERLSARVQTLVLAITSARERQQQQAQEVEARALALQSRTGLYQDLLTQYAALGQSAGSLNALMQTLAEEHREDPTPEQSAQSSLHFEELKGRMDEVVSTAQALTSLAEERDFSDLARQADGLRQQLLAARNKMNLLQKRLGLAPQARA